MADVARAPRLSYRLGRLRAVLGRLLTRRATHLPSMLRPQVRRTR